ncbi:WXG100 family type VII secretion target [Nocardioides sp. NPDC087217]|uniref:WXG100 family type VII secretion target n=1 Tax=Nocardioides sp. NPDC087217 TaxID=3364335 RepID=UPI0037FAB653
MGMTIPGELDFVLDLLGYEWPNVNEDAVRDAAQLLRGLESDLRGTLDELEIRINELGDGATAQSVNALIRAWTDNRTANMDGLLDALPGVATGIDVAADAIVALKMKVVAELTITAAQIAAAAATAVVTGGLSVVGNAAIIAARKKALDIATDIAMEGVMGEVASMVTEPLTGTITELAMSIAEAPIVTDGEATAATKLSYDLMEQIATALSDCGADQYDLCATFAAEVSALPFFDS